MELATRHKHTARSGRLSLRKHPCGIHRMRTVQLGHVGDGDDGEAPISAPDKQCGSVA